MSWTILGLFRLGTAITSAWQPWRWVVGLLWLAIGILWIVTAFSDYRNRVGRYVGRS